MSSRDRKRAERRKRKQRSSRREPEGGSGEQPEIDVESDAGVAEASANGDRPEPLEDIAAEAERRGVSKSEIRNERAREELEPLEEGERPLVVTIGAIISVLIAAITVGAWIAGAEVDIQNSSRDERPNVVQVFAPSILFAVMAWGMWGSRYWAVLGFQAIMAIFMVGAFITLVAATTILQALTALFVLLGAGALFWFMVKALARIQMPDRHMPR